jgi:hypothetical protein
MHSFSLFMIGASCAVIAMLQYFKRRYRLVPKGQVTIEWVEHEFPYDHPAKAQIVRACLYDVTIERHQELTPTEE